MSSEIYTKENRVNNKVYNEKIGINSGRQKLLARRPLCEQAIDRTHNRKNEREKEKLSRYSSRLYKKIFATHDIHVVHRGFPRTKDSA